MVVCFPDDWGAQKNARKIVPLQLPNKQNTSYVHSSVSIDDCCSSDSIVIDYDRIPPEYYKCNINKKVTFKKHVDGFLSSTSTDELHDRFVYLQQENEKVNAKKAALRADNVLWDMQWNRWWGWNWNRKKDILCKNQRTFPYARPEINVYRCDEVIYDHMKEPKVPHHEHQPLHDKEPWYKNPFGMKVNKEYRRRKQLADVHKLQKIFDTPCPSGIIQDTGPIVDRRPTNVETVKCNKSDNICTKKNDNATILCSRCNRKKKYVDKTDVVGNYTRKEKRCYCQKCIHQYGNCQNANPVSNKMKFIIKSPEKKIVKNKRCKCNRLPYCKCITVVQNCNCCCKTLQRYNDNCCCCRCTNVPIVQECHCRCYPFPKSGCPCETQICHQNCTCDCGNDCVELTSKKSSSSTLNSQDSKCSCSSIKNSNSSNFVCNCCVRPELAPTCCMQRKNIICNCCPCCTCNVESKKIIQDQLSIEGIHKNLWQLLNKDGLTIPVGFMLSKSTGKNNRKKKRKIETWVKAPSRNSSTDSCSVNVKMPPKKIVETVTDSSGQLSTENQENVTKNKNTKENKNKNTKENKTKNTKENKKNDKMICKDANCSVLNKHTEKSSITMDNCNNQLMKNGLYVLPDSGQIIHFSIPKTITPTKHFTSNSLEPISTENKSILMEKPSFLSGFKFSSGFMKMLCTNKKAFTTLFQNDNSSLFPISDCTTEKNRNEEIPTTHNYIEHVSRNFNERNSSLNVNILQVSKDNVIDKCTNENTQKSQDNKTVQFPKEAKSANVKTDTIFSKTSFEHVPIENKVNLLTEPDVANCRTLFCSNLNKDCRKTTSENITVPRNFSAHFSSSNIMMSKIPEILNSKKPYCELYQMRPLPPPPLFLKNVPNFPIKLSSSIQVSDTLISEKLNVPKNTDEIETQTIRNTFDYDVKFIKNNIPFFASTISDITSLKMAFNNKQDDIETIENIDGSLDTEKVNENVQVSCDRFLIPTFEKSQQTLPLKKKKKRTFCFPFHKQMHSVSSDNIKANFNKGSVSVYSNHVGRTSGYKRKSLNHDKDFQILTKKKR